MKELKQNFSFAWSYAKGQKKYLIILFLMNLLNIVFSIITPIFSAKIMIALTNNQYIQIIYTALIIFIVNFISNFATYIGRKSATRTYRYTLSLLETDLGRNILKLENTCLEKNGSGVFIQRLTNDTSRLADVFTALLGMTSQFIRYIGMLIAILLVNKIIFLYICGLLGILFIIERKRTRKRNEDDKVFRKSREKATGFVSELVRGARDIKMLNSEQDFISELQTRINQANVDRMNMQYSSWTYKLAMWQLRDFGYFLLLILLVLLMKEKILLPAIALVLHNYATNVSNLTYLIGDLLDYLKDFNLSSKRISDIICDASFPKEQFGIKHLEKINGDFEFQNVTFGYEKENPVLNKISFQVHANETVAFVGKSGAGKTTIFSLLCKMYNIEKGKILIDGNNIQELDKHSIRGNITIISQDPYIFNMTIKENLKLVKSDLTEQEMIEACKIACLDDFISALPKGYDTVIGEGGVNLSGGQKQRLAIARALVQKTEIILFDEATSALDNETQRKIQQAIENMKHEYTILIIAHRLSTIIHADRILYLEAGKIEAEGTHEELLKKCEKYRKLYESEIIKENDLEEKICKTYV